MQTIKSTEWQPIGTAPKDQRILAWCVFGGGAEARVCKWMPWMLAYGDGEGGQWYAHGCGQSVTHWMPLPAPPPPVEPGE